MTTLRDAIALTPKHALAEQACLSFDRRRPDKCRTICAQCYQDAEEYIAALNAAGFEIIRRARIPDSRGCTLTGRESRG